MIDTYGSYILETAAGNAWERIFNRYMFESRFRGYERIIDLGPGRCEFTQLAPDKITAVDNSPAVVEHYSATGLDIRLGSADALPFDDGSVDAVYCCWLLEHLTDPVAALAETRRVLRQNGYALFVVPSVHSLTRGFYNDYTHIRPFTPLSLAQIARAANCTNFATEHLFYTMGLRRLLPVLGEQRVIRLLHFSDRTARRFRLVNRGNLLLEIWS